MKLTVILANVDDVVIVDGVSITLTKPWFLTKGTVNQHPTSAELLYINIPDPDNGDVMKGVLLGVGISTFL